MDVFKAFHGVNRIKLQNVGLKEFISRSISFRISAGCDIEDALSLSEKGKARKAFVFGVGYENGRKINLGCSYNDNAGQQGAKDLAKYLAFERAVDTKIINPPEEYKDFRQWFNNNAKVYEVINRINTAKYQIGSKVARFHNKLRIQIIGDNNE